MHPFPNMQVASGRMLTPQWNPADKGSGITLSNNNLTGAAASGTYNVRATISHSSGKYVFAIHIDSGTDMEVGLSTSAELLTVLVGNDNNCVAYRTNGNIRLNSVVLSTVAVATTGSTITIAADLGSKLLWIKIDNGNWNNSGAADPAAGTGGIDFSTIAAGALFPILGATAASQCTLVPPPTIPAGFTGWEA